ncbi:GTP cyclohydrolase I [Nocardioides speluncae]|uniref:GTP cyclohydrolase I n=1 Tax=Nocardioides speluncae TaxID=2670337 RepID=UPI000D68E20B|nr:GTP cyclohydrolase I [Nocardioides speluncae]
MERTSRIDLPAAERAAADLLRALGVATTAESTRATPARMAKALAELLTPRPFKLTTFPNDEGYAELLVQEGIPFTSLCEHHGLPFMGTAVVAYLPGERIVGLSKLARVVEHFARRTQVQERLTKEIATWLQANLLAQGVGVMVRAEHLCMTLRGVQAPGTSTLTTSLTGDLLSDARARQEFFTLAGRAR